MNALRTHQLEQEHEEISAKANEIFEKHKHTIFRRVISALPYGVGMAIIAIVIPILTTRITGWSVLWPGLAVALVVVVLRIIREDYQLRARVWWAEKTEALYSDVLAIASEHEKLEETFRRGEDRLQAINVALHTLEEVIRSDVLATCDAAVNDYSSKHIEATLVATAETIRKDLKSLCKFICDIFGGPNQTYLRCGILIEEPRDTNSLIPIVVYDPSDPAYVSKKRFSKQTDFSGQLLTYFNLKLGLKDWKKYATYVISNVDNIHPLMIPFDRAPIKLQPDQTYIKCIAGNVIYCRDRNEEIIVLGVINIDSSKTNAIKEQDYRALQPYLFPAFRLFASRLLLLRGRPELVYSIWKESH